MRRLGRWWAGLSRRSKVVVIAAIVVLAALASATSPPATAPGSSPSPSPVAVASPSPSPSTAAPSSAAPSPSASPSAVPSESDPDLTPAIIPGLTATELRTMLTDRGLTCGPTEPALDVGGEVYNCGPTADANVLVRSRSDTIYYIDTTAISYATQPAAGTDLLAFVASLPFDGAMPTEARAWVAANIEAGGEVSIGPVYLLMYPTGGGRVLELSRSGQPGQP